MGMGTEERVEHTRLQGAQVIKISTSTTSLEELPSCSHFSPDTSAQGGQAPGP